MGKPRSAWNWNTCHRRIKEGRGQGTMAEYLPWLTIHDLASLGVSSRIRGFTTGRLHHLLSGFETAFFYILDASDKVLDIREQFPLLPLEATLRIADELGIRHPRDPVSRYPYVFTSDFVITTTEGLVVRSVKPSSELDKQRVVDKLAVERRYWEEKGIEWRLATEKEIDFQKARNLEWIYRSWDYPERLPCGLTAECVTSYFLNLYKNSHWNVEDIAAETEKQFHLQRGFGISTYQYLLLHKRITIDLSRPMDLTSARFEAKEGGRFIWIETTA